MKISLQFRGAFQMFHGWDMFGWEFGEIVCSKVDHLWFFSSCFSLTPFLLCFVDLWNDRWWVTRSCELTDLRVVQTWFVFVFKCAQLLSQEVSKRLVSGLIIPPIYPIIRRLLPSYKPFTNFRGHPTKVSFSGIAAGPWTFFRFRLRETFDMLQSLKSRCCH